MSFISNLCYLLAVTVLWLSHATLAANIPTASPTAIPTAGPTAIPTAGPTAIPTAGPTAIPTASPTAIPTAGPTAIPTVTSYRFDYKCALESGNFELTIPEFPDQCHPILFIPGYDTEQFCYVEYKDVDDSIDKVFTYPFFGARNCGATTTTGVTSIYSSNVIVRLTGCPADSFSQHITCEMKNVIDIDQTTLEDTYVRNIEERQNTSYKFEAALLRNTDPSSLPLKSNDTIEEAAMLYFNVTLGVDFDSTAVLEWQSISLLPKFPSIDSTRVIYEEGDTADPSILIVNNAQQVSYKFAASYFYKAIAATVLVKNNGTRRVLRVLQETAGDPQQPQTGNTIAFLPQIKRRDADDDGPNDDTGGDKGTVTGPGSNSNASTTDMYLTVGGAVLGFVVVLSSCMLCLYLLGRQRGDKDHDKDQDIYKDRSPVENAQEKYLEIDTLYPVNERHLCSPDYLEKVLHALPNRVSPLSEERELDLC